MYICTHYQITFGIIIPLSLASAEGFKPWIIHPSSTSESVLMFSLWYLYENIYEQTHCSHHLGFPMQNLLQSVQLPKIFCISVSEAYPYLICTSFWSNSSSRGHWLKSLCTTYCLHSITHHYVDHGLQKIFFRYFRVSFQHLLLGMEFKPHLS